jgi:hypothetical protein
MKPTKAKAESGPNPPTFNGRSESRESCIDNGSPKHLMLPSAMGTAHTSFAKLDKSPVPRHPARHGNGK